MDAPMKSRIESLVWVFSLPLLLVGGCGPATSEFVAAETEIGFRFTLETPEANVAPWRPQHVFELSATETIELERVLIGLQRIELLDEHDEMGGGMHAEGAPGAWQPAHAGESHDGGTDTAGGEADHHGELPMLAELEPRVLELVPEGAPVELGPFHHAGDHMNAVRFELQGATDPADGTPLGGTVVIEGVYQATTGPVTAPVPFRVVLDVPSADLHGASMPMGGHMTLEVVWETAAWFGGLPWWAAIQHHDGTARLTIDASHHAALADTLRERFLASWSCGFDEDGDGHMDAAERRFAVELP